MDRIPHNLFFLECVPFLVIERENAFAAGQLDECPAADDAFLQGYLEHPADVADPRLEKKLLALIVEEAERSGLAENMEGLKDNVRTRIQMLQTNYQDDPVTREAVQGAPGAAVTQHCWSTLALTQLLIRRYLVDKAAGPTPNDVVDFLHTVVPCSYCDFVLLDGKWSAAMDEATDILRRSGSKSAVAKTFSERRGGLLQFLDALDSWPKS